MEIKIVDYNPEWPLQFNKEANQLRRILLIDNLQIEHIGSTAVPGLAAKPVIDILIGLVREDQLDLVAQILMDQPNYHYVRYFENVMPFRRFFIKTKHVQNAPIIPSVISDDQWQNLEYDIRSCHIHCVALSHPFFDEHLKFRDSLRCHPETRKDYEALKKELALREWDNGADYAKAKSGFIRNLLDQ